MKKVMLSILAISALSMSAFAKDVSPKEFEKTGFFSLNNIDIHQANKVGEMYQVIGVSKNGNTFNSGKFLVSKDKQTVVAGSGLVVIDAKTGKSVKADVNMKEVLKSKAFTVGTGPDEFVVFTDPECPYCKRFEKELLSMKDKVKVHVFFYPLSMHPNAVDMIDYVMSKPEKEREAALSETAEDSFLSKGYKSSGKNDKIIAKHMALGAMLDVRGTPSVFDKNGNPYDIQVFMQKYSKPKVADQVDMDGIKFLKEKASMIVLNPESKNKELFVFTDTSSEAGKSVLAKENLAKLQDKYKVNIQLVPNAESADSFAEAVYIMIAPDSAKKAERIDYFATGKKMAAEEKAVLDKLVADKDPVLSESVIKIGSMPQIMKQMGIEKTPVFISETGKIVKINEL